MLLQISGEISAIIAIVTSAFIAVVLHKPLANIANKKGIYTQINSRSSHIGKVPEIGGVLLFAALYFAFTALVNFSHKELQFILLAITIIWVIGLYDDILELRARCKFSGELLSIAVVIFGGGLYFSNFHGLFSINSIGSILGILFTIIMMLGIINSINMIDGIDGLCSILSGSIIGFFSIWFFLNGHYNYAILGLSAIAALIPLFIRNVYSKDLKIFLGDNGSLVLGLLISVFVIKFNQLNIEPNSSWIQTNNAPGIAFAILAIPVLDTIRLIIVRRNNRKSPFDPDKNHIHHKLLLVFNNSHRKSTYSIIGLQSLYLLLGLYGINNLTNEILIALSIVIYFLAYKFINKLANAKSNLSPLIKTKQTNSSNKP